MISAGFNKLADMKDRSAYRRAWSLCMMPEDTEAFSVALKKALPAIRFVSFDYWNHFVDQERYEADRAEFARRRKLGLLDVELRRYMREPAGESLRYWDSLADPAETRFFAWIEPPGWTPLWAPEDEYGVRLIVNAPRLWFEYHAVRFLRAGRPNRFDWEEPKPENARDAILLEGQHFEVRWNPSEPEAEAFGKKVYNVLRKLTAFRFVSVERKSRRAYTGEVFGMQKVCLAGYHALEWTLKRRHNYLVLNAGGSYYKSPRYPFRRRDVFSPGELKQFYADRDEEFQKRLAQLHADTKRSFAANRSGLMVQVPTGGPIDLYYLHGVMTPAAKPETPAVPAKRRTRKARSGRSPK